MRATWPRRLPTSLPPVRSVGAILGGMGLALGLVSCNGDAVPIYEPTTDPAQLFMQLTLNCGAINLSTTAGYTTFQLTATPRNALGEPMTGLPAPTFSSTDTATVHVSPSGMLTALKAGSGIQVIAELVTSDNVRHADTAFVNVNATTDPPPALATLTIDPVPPDSTIIPKLVAGFDARQFSWLLRSLWSSYMNATPNLTRYLKVLTADGTAVPGLTTEYFSLDPTFATVDRRTGAMGVVRSGQARLVARTVAYGVAKADTVVFTTTGPSVRFVKITGTVGLHGSIFDPVIYVRQNGLVLWNNKLRPVAVVFDDSTAAARPADVFCSKTVPTPDVCGAGNFTFDVGGYRARQFPIPGTYTYRDTLSGAVGRIIVTDSLPSGS